MSENIYNLMTIYQICIHMVYLPEAQGTCRWECQQPTLYMDYNKYVNMSSQISPRTSIVGKLTIEKTALRVYKKRIISKNSDNV
jgi:hypothetical protein